MRQKLRQWGLAPAHSVVLQVPRALVASVICAVLDVAILVLLVEQGGWHPIAAATVAYLSAGILQYFLCLCWVFPVAPAKPAAGFAAFTLLSLVGLVITWLTIATLHDLMRVNYAAAKIAALGFAFSWNFMSRKSLVFRAPARDVAVDTDELAIGYSGSSSHEIMLQE